MNQRINQNSLKELPGKIPIRKLPMDVEENYQLDQSSEWLLPLILEMSENSGLQSDIIRKTTILGINVRLLRSRDKSYGEVMTLKVSFNASYNTTCVTTLEPITENLNFDCNICFVHESLKDDETLKEETEIAIGTKIYEVYFLEKGEADFSEALHEQVFLNYNFYPKK